MYDYEYDGEYIDSSALKEERFKKNKEKRGKRKKKPSGRYFIYTTQDLAILFNVARTTINRWIKQGYINPNSLSSIINTYIARNK